MIESKASIKNIFKIAGSFMAWVIGAGFATGQEILQFFSSYGYLSFGVILINLIGFILLGYLLLNAGYQHKDDSSFNPYKYFAGPKLGNFYTWLTTITLLVLIPVLIAGGGATLNQYYGINQFIGSAIMAIAVLIAYLIGFERLVKIVAVLGLSIIGFSLIVGIVSVISDLVYFNEIGSYEESLIPFQTSPFWIVSGLLYLGLNFFPSCAYFTKLGTNANSKKEVKYGAFLGGLMLVLSITLISCAILLNGDVISGIEIPVLYLAGRISYLFGAVFSIVLILGIFSSSSVMMWTLCSRFTFKNKKWNYLIAIGVSIFAYIVSLLSFGTLIATIYPIIGYVGVSFIIFILVKSFRNKSREVSN